MDAARNAVRIEPAYLDVIRGQALVFESYTVTDALAQTMASVISKMPEDIKESITVNVYGENSADAIRMFTNYNIAVTGELKTANTATVVYSREKLSVPAEHIRFIEVEQLRDTADNIVTAAQIVLAIFNMPFKQFAESMKARGLDIGVSESDMEALFKNADSADGIIKIKPVDDEAIRSIQRTSELVRQAA